MLAATGLLGGAGPALAQGAIECSAFLHLRDGSWRSLQEADMLRPAGIVHIDSGDILRAGSRSPKGQIAQDLDAICDSH